MVLAFSFNEEIVPTQQLVISVIKCLVYTSECNRLYIEYLACAMEADLHTGTEV